MACPKPNKTIYIMKAETRNQHVICYDLQVICYHHQPYVHKENRIKEKQEEESHQVDVLVYDFLQAEAIAIGGGGGCAVGRHIFDRQPRNPSAKPSATAHCTHRKDFKIKRKEKEKVSASLFVIYKQS